MCQWGANRKPWAGNRMSPPRLPRTPNRGAAASIDLSTSCGVVEGADHHCGDDLVNCNGVFNSNIDLLVAQ